VLDHDLLDKIDLQLIDPGSNIEDRVLALFVEKHGHVAVLQVRIYQDNAGVFVVQCDGEVRGESRAARATFGL